MDLLSGKDTVEASVLELEWDTTEIKYWYSLSNLTNPDKLKSGAQGYGLPQLIDRIKIFEIMYSQQHPFFFFFASLFWNVRATLLGVSGIVRVLRALV